MSAPPPPATATNENPNLCKKTWCLRRQRPRRSAATGKTIRLVAAGILFRRQFPVRRVEKLIRRSSVGWVQPERLRTRTGTPAPSRIFLPTCRNQKNGASLQQCGFAISGVRRDFAFPYSLSVRKLAGMFQCFAGSVKGFAIFSSNREVLARPRTKLQQRNPIPLGGRFSTAAIPRGAAATDAARLAR